MGETMDARSFPDSWHTLGSMRSYLLKRACAYRYYDMRAVSFPCDDLKPFDCFRVTHNIIKDFGSIFLNPMEYEHDKPIQKGE